MPWYAYVPFMLLGYWLLTSIHWLIQYPRIELAVILVLEREEKVTGRHLRATLRQQGMHLSGPHLNKVLVTMKDHGIVEHWVEENVIDTVTIPRHWYRLRPGGRPKQEEVFYRSLQSLFPRFA